VNDDDLELDSMETNVQIEIDANPAELKPA
jgi:hypothetical protein